MTNEERDERALWALRSRRLKEVSRMLPGLLGNLDKIYTTWNLSEEEKAVLIRCRMVLIEIGERSIGFEER